MQTFKNQNNQKKVKLAQPPQILGDSKKREIHSCFYIFWYKIYSYMVFVLIKKTSDNKKINEF